MFPYELKRAITIYDENLQTNLYTLSLIKIIL